MIDGPGSPLPLPYTFFRGKRSGEKKNLSVLWKGRRRKIRGKREEKP